MLMRVEKNIEQEQFDGFETQNNVKEQQNKRAHNGLIQWIVREELQQSQQQTSVFLQNGERKLEESAV